MNKILSLSILFAMISVGNVFAMNRRQSSVGTDWSRDTTAKRNLQKKERDQQESAKRERYRILQERFKNSMDTTTPEYAAMNKLEEILSAYDPNK